MSDCSLRKPCIVLLESRTRQFINTIITSSCSLTVGMYLEWPWCTTGIDVYQSQWLKNLLYLGALNSAGPAAFVASLIGLKAVLVIGMLITLCGSVAIVYSMDLFMILYIGRILQGFGAGIVCVIVPNYAAEIAEPKLRNLLTGLHYVCLLVGMVVVHTISKVYICEYVCSYVNMGIVAVVVMNLLVLLAINDPPYYQMKFNEKCTRVFDYNLQIQDEGHTKMIHNNCYKVFKNIKIQDNHSLLLFFTERQFQRPLVIIVCLISIQQFSGHFLLTHKLQCLYGKLSISELISTVTAILLLQLITSSICLCIVGVSGKKNALIISGLGMAITLLLMNVVYHMNIIGKDELWTPNLIFIYFIFYSIGYGPVPWILMPEICPRKSRLWTSGVSVSLYAFLSLVNNQSFYEHIKLVYGMEIVLLIFSIVSAIGAYFAYFYVTKKKDCVLK